MVSLIRYDATGNEAEDEATRLASDKVSRKLAKVEDFECSWWTTSAKWYVVGANYRAACRAKSTADFIAKLAIVEEEADESIYWIELLVEPNQVKEALVTSLLIEFNEVLSIVVASIKTSKLRRNPKSAIPNPKSI